MKNFLYLLLIVYLYIGVLTQATLAVNAPPAPVASEIITSNNECIPLPKSLTTVVRASKVPNSGSDVAEKDINVQLGDWIGIRFNKLDELQKEAKCRSKQILVYLNGQPMNGMTVSLSRPDVAYFQLRGIVANREGWAKILGYPSISAPLDLFVSIGIDGEPPLLVPEKFQMIVVNPILFILGLLFFAAIIYGFAKLAKNSNVLRERAPPDDTIAVVKGKLNIFERVENRGPYSLARAQAAWWFFIVLGSWLLIVSVTWDFYSSISTTGLILLGIGAGTVVSGEFIDASKDTEKTRDDRAQRAAELKARIYDLNDAERYCELKSKYLDALPIPINDSEKLKPEEELELIEIESRHPIPVDWLKSGFRPMCDSISDVFALSDLLIAEKKATTGGTALTPNETKQLAQLKTLFGGRAVLGLCTSRADETLAPNNVSFCNLVPLKRLKQEKETAISRYRKATYQSEGVWIDMLSDANGVSFHRFQLVSWTLILGFVFLYNTYADMNMPVFDQTLMGLLGLSAATYLGMKIPEPTVPPK